MESSQMPTVAAGRRRGGGTRSEARTSSQQTRTGPIAGPPELILDRYRLVKPLGSGAFGAVYAGRDERLDRDVAIKVLPRERIVGGRFEREARAAARLSHPAIVTLYEAAVDDEGAYLVSELVRGRTFDEVLQSGRLSDRDILAIGISLCEALQHAHEQGVIHRDVKPSNVLIPARPSSSGHPAKLTDFGVARIAGGDSLTRTGDVIGTLAYMAPEQAEGRECGPGADLYALAVVLYEALTGVNPLRQLRGTGRPRRLGAYLPPLRRQRRELPRGLGIAVDQALRPRPRERGELEELRRALLASAELVGEVRGVVVPGWRGEEPEQEPEPEELGPEWSDAVNGSVRATGLQAGGTGARVLSSPTLARAVAAGAGALAAAWLSNHLLTGAPLPPAAVGLVAAAAILLLPRLGWLAVVAVLSGVAAGQGHTGGALLLVLMAVASAALLLPVTRLWSLPAGGGVLAVIGVSGAWPGLVATARFAVWQRALIGGAGFLWTTAAADLSSGRSVWTGAVPVTLHHVLAALLASGMLAGAAVWAVAAAVAPWLIRRAHPVLSLVAVGVWSALTVATVQSFGSGAVSGQVVGALLGACVLVAPILPNLLGGARTRDGLLSRVS